MRIIGKNILFLYKDKGDHYKLITDIIFPGIYCFHTDIKYKDYYLASFSSYSVKKDINNNYFKLLNFLKMKNIQVEIFNTNDYYNEVLVAIHEKYIIIK